MMITDQYLPINCQSGYDDKPELITEDFAPTTPILQLYTDSAVGEKLNQEGKVL